VITLSAVGAHVLTNGTHHRLPAPEITAIDTTGAGDVFAGVMAAALDAGSDLGAATAWAIRAASLKVTRRGTIAGFPTAAEMAALRQCLTAKPVCNTEPHCSARRLGWASIRGFIKARGDSWMNRPKR
jgi:bifunctional ADP-heptose synthase (sugar kinase/adenylyltransferase)